MSWLITTLNSCLLVNVVDQYTPILHITSEEYGANNGTVTVEWAQQLGAVYTVRLSPLAPITLTGSTIRQLTLSYNTAYNLSVVAVTPCGNTTASIMLNYGGEKINKTLTVIIPFFIVIAKCGYPNLLLSISNDSVPIIDGYDGSVGSTIRFSCPPGLVLIGPNSVICTESGEWEPDPSGLMCNHSKG